MSQKWFFKITATNRRYLCQAIAEVIMAAPIGFIIRISEATRTLEQNARLWPMLTDIAKQVKWDGETLTDEEWKDWFTAALKKQRMVRGMDQGMIVFVGSSTSTMSKSTFSDLIELLFMFGAQQQVQWSEKSIKNFSDLRSKTSPALAEV